MNSNILRVITQLETMGTKYICKRLIPAARTMDYLTNSSFTLQLSPSASLWWTSTLTCLCNNTSQLISLLRYAESLRQRKEFRTTMRGMWSDQYTRERAGAEIQPWEHDTTATSITFPSAQKQGHVSVVESGGEFYNMFLVPSQTRSSASYGWSLWLWNMQSSMFCPSSSYQGWMLTR